MFPQPRIKDNIQRANRLVDKLHQAISLYGYRSLETSIIESADLFLTKAGDQIISKLFTFERHGRQLALRPEFTASAAYYYAAQAQDEIVRWQFSGPVFEDDPEDYRHNYQRLSVGAELIGMAGSTADAEIMGLAASGLKPLNITDWRLLIGHVGLTRQLLNRYNLDSRTQRFLLNHLPALQTSDLGIPFVMQQVEKALLGSERGDHQAANSLNEIDTQQMLDVLLDATQRGMTMGGRTRHDIAHRLLQKRQRAADRQQIMSALEFLKDWSAIRLPISQAFQVIRDMVDATDAHAQAILNRWQDTVNLLLGAYDVSAEQITLQPALARSWEYYTGMVFELRDASDRLMAGGGRYDELVSLVAGGSHRNVPAVGFAYYIDQLAASAQDTDNDAYLAVNILVSSTNTVEAAQWANHLRQRGVAVTLLPGDQTYSGTSIRIVDNTAHMGRSAYTPDQIDSLIANLD